jgi:hypothetical protein
MASLGIVGQARGIQRTRDVGMVWTECPLGDRLCLLLLVLVVVQQA